MTTRIGVKGSDSTFWIIYDKETGRYLGAEPKEDKDSWAKALEKAIGFAVMLANKDRMA